MSLVAGGAAQRSSAGFLCIGFRRTIPSLHAIVPLHASKPHIGACSSSSPSAAPTRPFHLPSPSHGRPLLIGRPSKKLPPLHLAACCALLGRVSWHHHRSSPGYHHHHTTPAHRMRPESWLRERLSPSSLSSSVHRTTCGRIQQPPCTTTWEYRHLINGFFFLVFLVSVKQRHRYQVLRHFGTSGV